VDLRERADAVHVLQRLVEIRRTKELRGRVVVRGFFSQEERDVGPARVALRL